jgi:hydrogenase nickel incorporation protein HypA/HybF
MHEYSIVQSLLESCENHANQNKASKVTKVVVKIGVLSGVEPDLLKSAFDTFKEATICENADFIINSQPVVIECGECGHQTTLDEMEFKCQQCCSLKVSTIDGEDMYLMSLELE